MHHGLAGAPRRQQRFFQLKIPARLAVGVVHQHHARLYFQAGLLIVYDALILMR